MSSRSSRAPKNEVSRPEKAARPPVKRKLRARRRVAQAAPEERITVAILSRKETLYSTRRLVEAVEARGHEARVLDTLHFDLYLERGRPALFYRGEPLSGVDVVIPRIGASITQYGLAVVNQFHMMGVPVLNDAVSIQRSRDKLRCLQIMAQYGIDMPRTVMMRERADIDVAVEQIGGLPAIVKLLQGTQGVGVMIAHSLQELESILDTMWTLGQDILLQEFVAESRGRDVRALVVGDRVVAAMRRLARVEGEFRSNLHRGGKGEALELTPAYREEAVKAARVVGLEVAGVDMLESKSGPKIMEINSSPGFEGLEKATGGDIASEIVEHAVRFARDHARGWSKPQAS